jgi:formate transporter
MEELALKHSKSIHIPIYKQYISAILSGICLALGAYGSLKAGFMFPGAVGTLIGSLIFPVGLIMIIAFNLFLFTGSNLYVVGAYEKLYSLKKVYKFWINVWLGNFIGSLFVAYIAYSVNISNHDFVTYVLKIYNDKLSIPVFNLILLAIGCNILVCAAVLMAGEANDTMGKVIVAAYPVTLFLILGFQHSVANMFYLPLGMMYDNFSFYAIFSLLIVTFGNIIGGVLFSSLLYLYRKNKNKVQKV